MKASNKFKVADKKAEIFQNTDGQITTTRSLISSQLKSYNPSHCTEVLIESQFSPRVKASSNNGFIETVINCYNRHHNLVIRPDDIWMAILTQFSFFINQNAEEFRGKILTSKGTKKLVLQIDGTLRSVPYDIFVTEMTYKIYKNLVNKTVKDWIQPKFTTTTTNDIISCGVVFMGTTKSYFNFRGCLSCGIPHVTLEGTVADWEAISNRLDMLKEFKLYEWYDMLKPILEEFIRAKSDKANIEFWNRICHHVGGGSGPRFLSGWLAAFAVFDQNGNWTDQDNDSDRSLRNRIEKPWPLININKIPTGIVWVDVAISGRTFYYESIMFAGHMGYEVLEDNRTLKPQIGWGIAQKLSDEDVERYHETAQANDQRFCDMQDVFEEVKK